MQLTYEEITRKLYLSDEDGIFSDEEDDEWETDSEGGDE
jgi:hypothetical protein